MAGEAQQTIAATGTTPPPAPPADSSATALPTLNPADSPYQPLSLPEVQPKQANLPAPEANPNLGASNKSGAIAYLADQVLRGAMRGYDMAQQHKADQYNKKLTAQQSIYNDQSKQLHDMAVAGVDPNSDEFKQARNRVQMAWTATMQTIGERIPQPKKSAKSKQGQSSDTDQSNLLQRALNHQKDPQDSLQAWYQGAVALGPPVFHQIQPYLTPAYQAKRQQEAQTAGTVAQTTGATADYDNQKAQINSRLAHAVASGAPQEEIDKLIKERDELNPSPKFPLAGLKRTGQNKDGQWEEWQVDEEGNEIKDTHRPLSTAGLNPSAPKVGTFGDFMVAAYGPKPTPKQYLEGEKLWKQTQGTTTVGTHTVLVTQGDKQVPFTFTTTSTKVPGGGGGTAPDVRADQGGQTATPSTSPSHTTSSLPRPSSVPRPATGSHAPAQSGEAIGYKDSPEYKGMVKQAIDSQKEYNSAYTNLSTMLKTAPAAKKGDGAAQVGIISAYLKSVVGGAGTGVRITKAEWDAATGTRPFLKGIEAKFSPDGYMSGAAIAPSQVDQMIHEVYAKTKALGETTKTAKERMLQAQKDQVPDNLKPNPPAATSHDDEIMNLLHPKQ